MAHQDSVHLQFLEHEVTWSMNFNPSLEGILVYCRVTQALNHCYPFIHLGRERHYKTKVFYQRTQPPWPGLESGPRNLELVTTLNMCLLSRMLDIAFETYKEKVGLNVYLRGLFVVIIKSGSFPLKTTCAVPVSHCHFRFLFSMRNVPWHFPVPITTGNNIIIINLHSVL